jgi:hypothetical protein
MKSDKRRTFLYCGKTAPRLLGVKGIGQDWDALGRRVLGVVEEEGYPGHVVRVVWVPKKGGGDEV